MSKTPNLGLSKPQPNDIYNPLISTNADNDLLDAAIGGLQKTVGNTEVLTPQRLEFTPSTLHGMDMPNGLYRIALAEPPNLKPGDSVELSMSVRYGGGSELMQMMGTVISPLKFKVGEEMRSPKLAQFAFEVGVSPAPIIHGSHFETKFIGPSGGRWEHNSNTGRSTYRPNGVQFLSTLLYLKSPISFAGWHGEADEHYPAGLYLFIDFYSTHNSSSCCGVRMDGLELDVTQITITRRTN